MKRTEKDFAIGYHGIMVDRAGEAMFLLLVARAASLLENCMVLYCNYYCHYVSFTTLGYVVTRGYDVEMPIDLRMWSCA